jgi:alpha-N-arabinofuranosidase
MANYAQTVNVIGAIKTTKTDAWLEGTGLVLKLYRNEFGTIPVTIEGAPQPLDVAATLTEDGKYLTVSVINATHQAYPLKLAFKQGKVAAEGTRFTVSGANDMIYNNKDAKNNISIHEEKVSLTNNTLIVPKESAAVYKFAL